MERQKPGFKERNNQLPVFRNYVYEHIPSETEKRRNTFMYDTKKYKLLNDLSVYEKKTVKSTFIYNKKQKNMIIGCVFN